MAAIFFGSGMNRCPILAAKARSSRMVRMMSRM